MPTIVRAPAERLLPRSVALALTMMLALASLVPTRGAAQTNPAAYAAADTSLRAEPSWDAAVVLLVPAGTGVTITAGPVVATDGGEWFAVTVWGSTGFMATAVLVTNGAVVPPPADAADTQNPEPATAAVYSTATTTALNLRAGPSTADAVILVMPAGAPVTVTGDGANGFLPVTYNGANGWAYAQYLAANSTPAPTPEPAPGGGAAMTTTSLNLRSGPSTADAVLLVMPAGSAVTLTGNSANGFLSIAYNGIAGWAFAQYLATGSTPPPSPTPNPSTGTATTTAALNLRSGPSTADGVILVIPAGGTVTLTGQSANGFSSVTYNGASGWAYATYLASGGTPPPNPTPTPSPGPSTGTATTTTSLNLRSGPSTGTAVLLVMPPGAVVGITGTPQSNFYPVSYNGTAGWASGDYLAIGGSAPPPPPAGVGTGIAWPMRGGEWTVIQGYNNGTHTNRSAFAQYKYALDLALVGGGTAGQPVYAPASGTIRWVDRGSGGMLIDAGNGYGVAFFHVTVTGGFASGQRIERGTYVGYISGPGGAGYASTPHIDLTVWQFVPGGHVATPFTGPNAISGQSFPDIGGFNQHYGTRIYP